MIDERTDGNPLMTRQHQRKLVVDLFAGGGGASTGIEQAIGRHVDIAINHDAEAIGMHEVNHPQTRHYRADIRDVMPRQVTHGVPVGLLHASPDCTDHSQAKGGQPRKQEIRSLAWMVHRWAGSVTPDVITLENVEQMLQWSPLIAKRDKATGRVITLDVLVDPVTKKKTFRVAEPGEVVPRRNQFLVPDPKRKGQNWQHFVEGLRRMGYVVQWRVIKNANLGAHSTRERLYMVARRDGLPIVWPEQTHAKKPIGKLKAWQPMADCIDWGIEGKSIFNRKKPLAEATMRRIAHGMRKYVLECPEPFIVPATHSDTSNRNRPVSDPAPTVTAANRGESMLLAPTLVQMGYGERKGQDGQKDQAPRALDLQAPLGTIVAGGGKFGLTAAFMVQANGGFNTTHARDVREPVSPLTTSGSQQQLITAHLATLRHHSVGRDMREPVPVIAAGGEHHALVEYTLSKEHEEGALRCAAFLMRYHREGGQWADVRDPATTITTKDRLALVTVWLKGEPYVVVDICLRMLEPRELYNAQDFPQNYIIDHTASGKKLSKTAQVRMCGNSVSPLPMRLIVAANYSEYLAQRMVA